MTNPPRMLLGGFEFKWRGYIKASKKTKIEIFKIFFKNDEKVIDNIKFFGYNK